MLSWPAADLGREPGDRHEMWGIELEAEWWMNRSPCCRFRCTHGVVQVQAHGVPKELKPADATLANSRTEQYIEVASGIKVFLEHRRAICVLDHRRTN